MRNPRQRHLMFPLFGLSAGGSITAALISTSLLAAGFYLFVITCQIPKEQIKDLISLFVLFVLFAVGAGGGVASVLPRIRR